MMPTFVEAALRSLLVAAMVGAGLRALAVRNVLVQKAAWGAVLAAALVMPLLMPAAARWPAARLVVHADAMTLLEELQARIRTKSAAQPTSRPVPQSLAGPVAVIPKKTQPAPKPRAAVPAAAPREEMLEQSVDDAAVQAAMVVSAPEAAAPRQTRPPALQTASTQPKARFHLPRPAALAMLLYAVVALMLVGRLLAGLCVALVLWHRARPVDLGDWFTVEPLDLRASEEVSSPVTIGSSVVLPADCSEWSAEKLRIVLAHERSHIRQKDFYLQLIAGLYAAVVWFSPLGWWIKARLSELSEAISDRAGLDEAASRTSYAQLLLEFAAAPRPTPIGVAMARTHSLTRRIERLLNDTAFRQSFTVSPRTLAAAFVLPVALTLTAAMVRVQAVGQDAPPAAPQSAPPPAAPAASAAPDAAPEPREGQAAPEPDDTITAPSSAPAPPAALVPSAPAAPVAPPTLPGTPDHMIVLTNEDAPVVLDMDDLHADHTLSLANHLVVRKDSNGDSYVIVRGGEKVSVKDAALNEALQKARKVAKGDFVLCLHQGTPYLIEDPATIAQIESAVGPMNFLTVNAKLLADNDLRSAEFRKKMAEQQKEFAKQQQRIFLSQKEWQDKQTALTAPELKTQLQELNETVAKLDARQDQKLTNEDVAKLRSEVAELQMKLSGFPMHFELQSFEMPKVEIPKINIEIDKQVIEAQKQVAEAQKQMQRESDEKMKSIIDRSLKDGKAKPLQ